MPTHAVIWIDHKEARIFHIHPEATDETTVVAPQHHVHRHPKGRGGAGEHPDDTPRFFGDAARFAGHGGGKSTTFAFYSSILFVPNMMYSWDKWPLPAGPLWI
jgi:hypothetical protein